MTFQGILLIRFISSLLLISLNLLAQEVTLKKLLNSATLESERLQIFTTDEHIETARLESTYGQYYPKLSVSYNTEYNRDENGFSFGTESVGDTVMTSGTRYQSSMSLNLNHELYHFGTTSKSVDIAKSEVEIKHLLWCEEEKKLHQTILERYSSAVKMKVKSNLKNQMLGIRQKLFEIKKRLYKAGRYSKVDLGDEAIFIIDLEREIALSLLQYKEDIIQLSNLSYIELDEDETELLPIALNYMHALADDFEDTTEGHKYAEQISQKEDELSMLNRSQFPTIGMYGNYYFYGSDPDEAYDSFKEITKNSWKLGISISMSLFEGFKYNDESDRLQYELQRIKLEHNLRKREYEYESKVKINKISYIQTLEAKDQILKDKSQEKIKMVSRLRKSHQVNSVTELNAKLEGLERELNLKIEQYEAAYENASLDILYRGVDQCTQH